MTYKYLSDDEVAIEVILDEYYNNFRLFPDETRRAHGNILNISPHEDPLLVLAKVNAVVRNSSGN